MIISIHSVTFDNGVKRASSSSIKMRTFCATAIVIAQSSSKCCSIWNPIQSMEEGAAVSVMLVIDGDKRESDNEGERWHSEDVGESCGQSPDTEQLFTMDCIASCT